MTHAWGIDLGGTKIEGAVVDTARPDVPLVRQRVPTGADRGYEHILGQVAKLLATLEKELGGAPPDRIGIGTPGNIDPATQLLNHSNTQCLNGRRFQEDLESLLKIKVTVENDANCLALAESMFGAARGYPTVFGIILGTGVGGALIAHGKILPGRHGTAGEWGQIVLDPEGPASAYGTRGTVEAFISGPGLERYYSTLTGKKRLLHEIAKATDEPSRKTIDRLLAYFAQSISIVVNIFDPHAIVIGGGVGNIDALYSERARAEIGKHTFAQPFATPLLRPSLGDSAGVFGAALLRD